MYASVAIANASSALRGDGAACCAAVCAAANATNTNARGIIRALNPNPDALALVPIAAVLPTRPEGAISARIIESGPGHNARRTSRLQIRLWSGVWGAACAD